LLFVLYCWLFNVKHFFLNINIYFVVLLHHAICWIIDVELDNMIGKTNWFICYTCWHISKCSFAATLFNLYKVAFVFYGIKVSHQFWLSSSKSSGSGSAFFVRSTVAYVVLSSRPWMTLLACPDRTGKSRSA